MSSDIPRNPFGIPHPPRAPERPPEPEPDTARYRGRQDALMQSYKDVMRKRREAASQMEKASDEVDRFTASLAGLRLLHQEDTVPSSRRQREPILQEGAELLQQAEQRRSDFEQAVLACDDAIQSVAASLEAIQAEVQSDPDLNKPTVPR